MSHCFHLSRATWDCSAVHWLLSTGGRCPGLMVSAPGRNFAGFPASCGAASCLVPCGLCSLTGPGFACGLEVTFGGALLGAGLFGVTLLWE